VSLAISNDYVARLSDVQRGVGNPGCDAALDSDACAANRIDTIESSLVNLQISKRNVSGVLGHDSIGGIAKNVKVLDAKIAARRENAVGELATAVEMLNEMGITHWLPAAEAELARTNASENASASVEHAG